jgi:SNF2 family DNA or RNA helicase
MSKVRVDFEVNSLDLVVQITLSEDSPKLINSLKLLFSNIQEDYGFEGVTFKVPWFEIRRLLPAFTNIIKRENALIVFDENSKRLVQDVVKDRRAIKDRGLIQDLEENEILNLLDQIGFTRKLKNEQIRDVLALLKLQHGANFSVPGAGKTTTILAVHFVLKHWGFVTKLFVISPINAFISWKDEIAAIFPNQFINIKRLTIADFESIPIHTLDEYDVVVVNYEKLRRKINNLIPFFFRNNVHLILDESHRIKSGQNNISYNQIIKLGDISKRRDILSGTPMPQSFRDLEPQFDFLWPGENIIPSNIGRQTDALIQNAQVNSSIKGLFVRTTKKELDLIDPVIRYVSLPMGPVQQELYRLFKSEAARVLSGLDRHTKTDFRKIGKSVVKLLQAATNPMLLSIDQEYHEEPIAVPIDKEFWELLGEFSKYEKPVKIEYLKTRVREITSLHIKNKILIWTYFVQNIKILERIFSDYNPVVIYGGVPSGSDEEENTREYAIRKFHDDPSCKVMIGNPQACGEAISLHKACHFAIYLDRNFNAAFFLQSIDRIHRLGLSRDQETNIEIIVAENTIDEILIERLNNKILAMGAVLEDPYLQSLAYDPADILPEDEIGLDQKDIDDIRNHLNG